MVSRILSIPIPRIDQLGIISKDAKIVPVIFRTETRKEPIIMEALENPTNSEYLKEFVNKLIMESIPFMINSMIDNKLIDFTYGDMPGGKLFLEFKINAVRKD